MLDREQLETFATITEHGSFDRAARVLNVTRGAVSQRIKALEESLTTVLLVREKPVRPTARGEALLRHVKALRMLEGAVLREIVPQHEHQPVAVAIAVNNDSLTTWFRPIVSALLAQRRVSLEIISDDQDHTLQRLARGEVVGCISAEPAPPQGFVADRLGCMEYRCVASPRFAAEHFPRGLQLQSVLRAPAVLFDRKDGLHDAFLQRIFGMRLERYVRNFIPAPASLVDAIALDGGYGLVPTQHADSLLARGELVDLAPNNPVRVALYWHHWGDEFSLAHDVARMVISEARASLRQHDED